MTIYNHTHYLKWNDFRSLSSYNIKFQVKSCEIWRPGAICPSLHFKLICFYLLFFDRLVWWSLRLSEFAKRNNLYCFPCHISCHHGHVFSCKFILIWQYIIAYTIWNGMISGPRWHTKSSSESNYVTSKYLIAICKCKPRHQKHIIIL